MTVPSILPQFNGLTASAVPVLPKSKFRPAYNGWQDQLWDYYDRGGEFESAVAWRANTLSRVRLVAAELSTTGEEPTALDEGPAADIVSRLAGGTGGQAQLMKELAIHLSVPGEGWVVGQTIGPEDVWSVASADEIRSNPKTSEFQLKTGESRDAWRTLPATDTTVMRVWNPHPRYGWQADSGARHALDALLELDLINKRVVAELTSRLSNNGVLLYDKGRLSLPAPTGETPEGVDSVDPFADMLVTVASDGIRDPMSSSATIPIPIGFDGQDMANLDPRLLIQHIRFSEFLDEKLLHQRESAVKRLAISLDMPAEILLGMSGLNHWGAWQIEESGIKIHIAPLAELICHAFTVGYLVPYLKQANEPLTGPNGGRLVVWYDPSEITVRPDRSDNVRFAYDRGEVSGDVLRREIGLNEEGDRPTDQDLRDWTEKYLARQPATAPFIYAQTGGSDIGPVSESETSEVPEDDAETESDATPDTRPTSGPSEAESLSALSSEELDRRFMAMAAEIRSRSPEPEVSAWQTAESPLRGRVTPERRSAGVV